MAPPYRVNVTTRSSSASMSRRANSRTAKAAGWDRLAAASEAVVATSAATGMVHAILHVSVVAYSANVAAWRMVLCKNSLPLSRHLANTDGWYTSMLSTESTCSSACTTQRTTV